MRFGQIFVSATAICLSQIAAHAQTVELGEVRLLGAPDAPAQTVTFEIINDSDREIVSLAISCHLIDEAGKAIAVKVVRFRHVPPGSTIRDAAFPVHVRGVDVACRVLRHTSGEAR